jgi:hypothetical protein
MLQQLPRLRGVKLGVHAFFGAEEDGDYPNTDEFEWVHLPAMAGVTALTGLELVGETSLPPDWRQLSSLQRLRMMGSSGVPEDNNGDEGGALTALTALTHLEIHTAQLPGEKVQHPALQLSWWCLQHINEPQLSGYACSMLLPLFCLPTPSAPAPAAADAALVATAPSLAEVVPLPRLGSWIAAGTLDARWRNELAQLRPDIALTWQ